MSVNAEIATLRRRTTLAREAQEQIKKLPQGEEGFWAAIDIMVKFWSIAHRDAYTAAVTEARLQRKNAFNQFASNKDKSFRHLAVFPLGFDDILGKVAYQKGYNIRKKHFTREFVKRYPQFRVPEKL